MKNVLVLLSFMLLSIVSNAQNKDSISLKSLQYKYEQIEDQLKEVRRDELNYRMEKDLLKDTYSNNYDRINTFITLMLLIIAVLGFVGLKDITSIKKEYVKELETLGQLKTSFEIKINEFDLNKTKFESEIRDITLKNEEQNRKIKVIEFKEKIDKYYEESQYGSALEYCILGLDLKPDDILLLKYKAHIQSRMRSYNEAVSTYNKVLEVNPDDKEVIMDLAETYLFSNQKNEHLELIKKYNQYFTKLLNGKLCDIFDVIIYYQEKNKEELTKRVLAHIDSSDLNSKSKRTTEWQFLDSLIYLANEQDSPEKTIALNFFWYLDGQISSKTFFSRTQIPIPEEQAEL